MIDKWLGITSVFQNAGFAHLEKFEGLICRVFHSRLKVIWAA
jgi:hypothetical protein